MGLFLGKKRRDIRAWEDVLFEKLVTRSVQPDIALYERLTKAQIAFYWDLIEKTHHPGDDSRTFKNNPTIILYLCLRQPLIQGNIRLDRASYRLFEQYILPCADVAAFFPQEEAHDQSPPEREDDKPTFSVMNIIARI